VTAAYAPPEFLEGDRATVKGDFCSLGLRTYFVLTRAHPFDPKRSMVRLGAGRTIGAGLNVRLPGVAPGPVGLIKSMVSVMPWERPGSAREVFEVMCREKFAFFAGVDAIAARVELAKSASKTSLSRRSCA
jgi:hypothetical protein